MKINSTVCPLCQTSIGCSMDDRHAAQVKEMKTALIAIYAEATDRHDITLSRILNNIERIAFKAIDKESAHED
jgi:hypothetical protein